MSEIMFYSRPAYGPFHDVDQMNNNYYGKNQLRVFNTDIQDNGDSYTLEAELPGFAKEDIQIDIDQDRLTIQAVHKTENDQKDDQGNYLRRERYYGSYSRSFNISDIESSQISAAYENGVLKLTLPKRAVTVPTSRRLEIK
ncbi:MAG: Hsp20/alpha crystallin family protein [Clostridiales bacterium]|nr:Hsp20/alpha crystallin family protein [Clostridiales bacterium]